MHRIVFAVLLTTFALGLGACNYVEEFYATQCASLGGTWGGSGCEGKL
jgi:hypothetical protein